MGLICELLKREEVPVRGVLGKLAGGLWKLNTQKKPSRDLRRRGEALAKMAGVTVEEVKRMAPDLTDAGKRSLMLDCLRSKYAKEPYRSLLLSTGMAKLHEAVQRGKPNSWTSTGGDWLGRLLMRVRGELRSPSPKRNRVRLKGKRCPRGFRRDPEDAAWCREKAVPRGGSRRRTVRELQRVLKSRGVSRCLSYPKKTLEHILENPSCLLRSAGRKRTCADIRRLADAGSPAASSASGSACLACETGCSPGHTYDRRCAFDRSSK